MVILSHVKAMIIANNLARGGKVAVKSDISCYQSTRLRKVVL